MNLENRISLSSKGISQDHERVLFVELPRFSVDVKHLIHILDSFLNLQ